MIKEDLNMETPKDEQFDLCLHALLNILPINKGPFKHSWTIEIDVVNPTKIELSSHYMHYNGMKDKTNCFPFTCKFDLEMGNMRDFDMVVECDNKFSNDCDDSDLTLWILEDLYNAMFTFPI